MREHASSHPAQLPKREYHECGQSWRRDNWVLNNNAEEVTSLNAIMNKTWRHLSQMLAGWPVYCKILMIYVSTVKSSFSIPWQTSHNAIIILSKLQRNIILSTSIFKMAMKTCHILQYPCYKIKLKKWQ